MLKLYEPDESEAEWLPRTAREVAERCIALCCVAAAGQFPFGFLHDWLKREELWSALSPRETAYLMTPAPDSQQKIDATWRAESLQLLLWSLGKIETQFMRRPTTRTVD